MAKVLVTGATGYVGGRLVPRLLEAGYSVRVLVRNPDRIRGRAWSKQVEIHEGDLLDAASLKGAFDGIDVAYYLVHSMMAGAEFEQRDREAAMHFAASAQGVKHVIYLGGLLPKGKASSHLKSRSEVGEILRGALPTTEFRAGPVIGAGSASFEIVRYLTERLPVMITPKWIDNKIQPIAIRDILSYLIAAAKIEPAGIVEVGAQAITFREMMAGYARVKGLKRRIQPVPVLAPHLAALWVNLVTPIPRAIAVPILEGIVNPLLADTSKARRLFPNIQPIPYQRAVELALERIISGQIETAWSGALRLSKVPHVFKDEEGMIRDIRRVTVNLPPEQVYRAFSSIGGERGWLTWNWAWRLRGALDKIVGGPGLRRGRRNALELAPGEALDFWRVEDVVPGRMLRLRAEMRVPGRAWIQWEALPYGKRTQLVQTAFFAPHGLLGTMYWYVLYPIHVQIFGTLAKQIASMAEKSYEAPSVKKSA